MAAALRPPGVLRRGRELHPEHDIMRRATFDLPKPAAVVPATRWPLRSRAVGAGAFALLLAVFLVDTVTPQRLIVAILLDISIVLAALTRSRRLTASLVVAALGADALAAFVNAAREGYVWDPIGLGDRALSMLSIVMVGVLSTAVQERSERVGHLAAQQARSDREAALAASAARLRASLSFDLVLRDLVREARRLLHAERAAWYPAGDAGEVLTSRDDEAVDGVDGRVPSEIASLVRRVLDDETVAAITPNDPVGRLVLDALDARSAIAIPLLGRGAPLGVAIVTYASDEPDEAAIAQSRGFAAAAENALAQAQLFGALEERNQALVERQDVIRDLVYALSHDLRTPLTALSMTLTQATAGAYGTLPPAYENVLRESLASVEDLRRLAETLLLVARFESGERRSEQSLVEVDALASEIGSELHAMAELRGTVFTVEAGSKARVVGSRGDFKRAIANLVANALQHTPAGGAVRLQTSARGDHVEVVVCDDGFGVDERARAALFQRFGGSSTAGGGTGLGLYIVRRIAEEAGGTVAYRPNVPRGSVFTVTLPIARG